ncbi:MAG: metallophosphoesterase family protein [Lachnospiraceae bacterium]|nr:metallophosphoesterase family protein [Lachnospiraceae bacterium]
MKILTISDTESKLLWDYFDRKYLADIDLILACGDLDPRYLEFLVTLGHCPLLYVHGNHDEKYKRIPPLGCVNIEDKIYVHNGVRILGLGGSRRYRDGAHQYTEVQMKRRAFNLWPKLLYHKGFDILLTHAPARGHGDLDTPTHRGFETFVNLIDKYNPAYHIHGHVHLNYNLGTSRIRKYNNTTMINAYERYVFDYGATDKERH